MPGAEWRPGHRQKTYRPRSNHQCGSRQLHGQRSRDGCEDEDRRRSQLLGDLHHQAIAAEKSADHEFAPGQSFKGASRRKRNRKLQLPPVLTAFRETYRNRTATGGTISGHWQYGYFVHDGAQPAPSPSLDLHRLPGLTVKPDPSTVKNPPPPPPSRQAQPVRLPQREEALARRQHLLRPSWMT